MNLQELRARLARGEATIGTWLQFPSPGVAETMARAGYDWVTADLEHASFGMAALPDIFRAVECGGALPFARLPEASKVWIKAALEAGAQGLIFPMIETAGQLAEAVDLATYPGQDTWRPSGDVAAAYRGVGFCRANDFGKNFDSYRADIAPNVFIVAQIEHIRAVRNIDAILDHKRLDAIMVGPYDLSGSMGITGDFANDDFREAMDTIASACRRHNVIMGCHVVTPDTKALGEEIRRGSQFIAYGIDTVFLWRSAVRPQVC